jgi:hypothetical protein
MDDWVGVDMAENPTTPAPAQPSSYGYCAWHQAFASGVRLIQVQEQGSGPGGGAFACRPCRESYGLVPFADQAL